MESKFEPLLLLSTISEQQIDNIFQTCFNFRHDIISLRTKNEWKSLLAAKSLREIDLLINSINLLNTSSLQKTSANIFPPNFNTELRTTLIKVISSHLESWKQDAQLNTISNAAKLVDFNWRVDMKTSSDKLNTIKSNTSSVIVDLHLQEQTKQLGVLQEERLVQLEFNKESLSTMLEGLSKINNQLSDIRNTNTANNT